MRKIIDTLQARYEKYRSFYTWGTPQVSPFFFDRWRDKGLFQALGYLIEREKSLGNPHIHPVIKAGMNLTGCCLLVIGIETTKTPLKCLKGIIYALLFSSQGGGVPKNEPGLGIVVNPDYCPKTGGAHAIVYDLRYEADRCVGCGAIFREAAGDGPRYHVPDVKDCGCAWNESCMICREEED